METTTMSAELINFDHNKAAEIIKSVIVHGDISKLSDDAKTQYFMQLAKTLGLDPLTRPFDVMRFQGKEIMYANKGCAEQLRNLYHVSLEIVETKIVNGVYIVRVKATMPNGRNDESTGAVHIDGLKGDALANCLMKAETKAKRRATLSICSLGMLDESELETVGSGFSKLSTRVEPEPDPVKSGLIGLPGVHDKIDRVPDFFIKKVPAFKSVAGILFVDMDQDEIVFVMDLALEWAAKGKNKEAVDVLNRVYKIASAELDRRQDINIAKSQDAEFHDVA